MIQMFYSLDGASQVYYIQIPGHKFTLIYLARDQAFDGQTEWKFFFEWIKIGNGWKIICIGTLIAYDKKFNKF